jgi:hypothetical protein
MSSFLDQMIDLVCSSEPAKPITSPTPPKKRESKPGVVQTPWDINQQESRMGSKFGGKKVEEWNQRDLVKYMAHVYYEAMGGSYQYAWAADSQNLAAIQFKLEKTFEVADCSRQLCKDYIDFAFERFVIPKLKKDVRFTTKLFCNDAAILAFKDRQPIRQAESVVADVPVQKAGPIKVDDMNAAFEINGRYFVKTFGPIVYVNYLVKFQKVEQVQAVKNATAASAKAVAQSSPGEMLAIVNKFGPYPKWLPFTSVSDLAQSWLHEIQLSDDNPVMAVFK